MQGLNLHLRVTAVENYCGGENADYKHIYTIYILLINVAFSSGNLLTES